MASLSMTAARQQFGSLVRRASTTRERTTITDRGQPAAVLVGAQELADLEEALALAEFHARESSGRVEVTPHADVRRRLGLTAPASDR
jgi:prevent-host-death family protein